MIKSTLTLLLASLAMIYLLVIGATFNGLVNVTVHSATLIGLIILVIAWLLLRWRGHWTWHTTPLDGAILLWGIAFAVSTALNVESARRIAMGLWYVGVYIGVWFILSDMLANRLIKKDVLINALLFAGIVILWIALAQTFNGLRQGVLVRPVGTLGNPNTFSALLVILLPLAVGRAIHLRKFGRMLMILYAGVIGFVLMLAQSRGAWMGSATGVAALFFLLSPPFSTYKAWWAKQDRLRKSALSAGVLMLTAVLVIGALVLVLSLTQTGRTVDLRIWIYDTAITVLTENPVGGSGLFTFGGELSRLNSIPPHEPHSHAHNVFLQVGAELGIVGLIALGFTLWKTGTHVRRNLRQSSSLTPEAAAALIGFGVHHLIDFPSMMPAIALLGLLVLVVATTSEAPNRAQRFSLYRYAVPILWLVVFGTGIWSSAIYQRYIDSLTNASRTGDFAAAAAEMSSVITADSSMMLYQQQYGMLLALAGDTVQAQQAYERAVILSPQYFTNWASLAALRSTNGDSAGAANAIQEAQRLAPDFEPLWYPVALYAEADGDLELARQAYQETLDRYPTLTMIDSWGESPLRRELEESTLMFPGQQVVLALVADDVDAAVSMWDESADPEPARGAVISALLAFGQGDPATAQAKLEAARVGATFDRFKAWYAVGLARAALFNNQPDEMERLIQSARDYYAVMPFENEIILELPNISYGQFLRLANPRQFVPQLPLPQDGLLLYLLEVIPQRRLP